MTILVTHVISMFIVFALITATASQAQLDPSKALVGKWEGEIAARRGDDPNRTLIIESVTERDGKLVGEGRYGITGKGLGKVQITVDPGGPRPAIQFTSGSNSSIRLDLVDEKSLVGTLIQAGSSQRGNDRAMRLEKAKP